MYWALDVVKLRTGKPSTIEDTVYFRNKAEAVAWKVYYNTNNSAEHLIARDLREEKEEGLVVVLNNYFKTFYAQDKVTEKALHKFCGI